MDVILQLIHVSKRAPWSHTATRYVFIIIQYKIL